MSELQQSAAERRRAVSILARSLFRELVHNGFETGHLITLTTELLELTMVTLRVRAVDAPERREDGVTPNPQ